MYVIVDMYTGKVWYMTKDVNKAKTYIRLVPNTIIVERPSRKK